jgi:hypothetical protein
VALLPTLISREIIFGSYLQTGYAPVTAWAWRAPALWNVLFSSDHGMLSWTPILTLALVGLILFRRVDKPFATFLLVAFLAFYGVVALHPDWDGLSSFGNRFFISLTPIYILGLASFFDRLTHSWRERYAANLATCATAVLILWNLGLIYQWGTHLIPARGPISWSDAAYNQVVVVPQQLSHTLRAYLTQRKQLMGHLEQEDVKQIKSGQPGKTEQKQ